jgi:hypothetical protein
MWRTQSPRTTRGWKNDLDDCYVYAAGIGGPYDCNSQGTFDEFLIPLTGKVAK